MWPFKKKRIEEDKNWHCNWINGPKNFKRYVNKKTGEVLYKVLDPGRSSILND